MTQPDSSVELLRAGIAEARAGRHHRARDLLQRAVTLNPNHATAWLWLSGVTEDPLEQESCLQNAVDLDPGNEPARNGLVKVRQYATQILLQRGVTAVQEDKPEQARVLLTQVVERDEANVNGWLWLSRVADTPEDQEVCYENVVALDPNNAEIAQKLATIRQVREVANANLWADVPQEAPEESRVAPTLAAAVLGEAYVQKHTTVIPEPEARVEPPSVKLWVKYENELLCPYCAAPTDFNDRRCAACGNPLWMKLRRRETPSVAFWILLSLQILATGLCVLIPVMALYLVSRQIELPDFPQLFNVYLGLSSAVSPEMTTAAFARMPRATFFASWVPAAIAATLTMALALRWPVMYYLMLINAVASLLASIAGIALFASQGTLPMLAGSAGVIIAVLSLIFVVNLEDDFKKDKIRLLLRVDEGIKEGIAYLIRGRQYADQKLWARAAVHYRRAAALLSYQTDGHIAAATALIKLKDYELAGHILKNAQAINVEDTQIAELIALLETQQNK